MLQCNTHALLAYLKLYYLLHKPYICIYLEVAENHEKQKNDDFESYDVCMSVDYYINKMKNNGLQGIVSGTP